MGLKIQASKQVFKQNNLLAKASNDRSLELYFVFQLGENVNLVTLLKVATKKLTKPVNFLSLPRMKECHLLEIKKGSNLLLKLCEISLSIYTVKNFSDPLSLNVLYLSSISNEVQVDIFYIC